MTSARVSFIGAVAFMVATVLYSLSASVVLAQNRQNVGTDNAPVTLIADELITEADGILIAQGSVEVFREGRHLKATQIIYDQNSDRLQIEGPIILTEGANSVILASSADLSTDLREGLILSSRLVLDQRLQIAGKGLQRQAGRFSTMRTAVASSCEVCKPGRPPLWELRATRVIHDEEKQRLYFRNAYLRVLRVPVFYFPALSTPEPGVRRARGFLVPSSETSDLFGTGIRLPYFIPLGDHADITLTPYLAGIDGSSTFSRTLEAEYEHLFVRGRIAARGAYSQDSTEQGPERGYLFLEGAFRLPNRINLRFDLETTSDDAYLVDYLYAGKDRLDSAISLTRVTNNSRAQAEFVYYNSLRASEDNQTIPSLVTDLCLDRRWQVDQLPGFVDLSLVGHSHVRRSDEDIDGRDQIHGRAFLGWRHATANRAGIRFAADARVIGDVKHISQDSTFPDLQSAITPGLAFSTSWPWQKTNAKGTTQIIEPVVQLVWTGDYNIDAPGDDSSITFDKANLFGFQRIAGLDEVEDGLRFNLATRWRRFDTDGLSVELTLGRVFRETENEFFTPGTGLSGVRSDWLAQVDWDYKNALTVRTLNLIQDDGSLTLNETRLRLRTQPLSMAAGYVWQIEDPALNQAEDLSELTFDAIYNIAPGWNARVDLRRDLITNRTVTTEFGLGFKNECIKVDFSGLRRFRNTVAAEATYTYGVTVSLTGFGTGGTENFGKARCGR
ncbi:MAG: LPS assembly protein LptD [Pseudomonadota bacterium]